MLISRAVLTSALIKAVRTFIQAFGPALAASSAGIVDLSTAKAALLAAGAAGVAAVWRLIDTTDVPSLVDPAPLAGVAQH